MVFLDDPGENSCDELLRNCQSIALSNQSNEADTTECEIKESVPTVSDNFVKTFSSSSSGQSSNDGLERHLAALYAELSRLWFNRSDYDASYQYSVKALQHLKGNAPPK